jgi:hypothetical protein
MVLKIFIGIIIFLLLAFIIINLKRKGLVKQLKYMFLGFTFPDVEKSLKKTDILNDIIDTENALYPVYNSPSGKTFKVFEIIDGT